MRCDTVVRDPKKTLRLRGLIDIMGYIKGGNDPMITDNLGFGSEEEQL